MFIPNQPLFITCKTMQGRFLLKPTKKAKRAMLGILARCTQKFPEIDLFAFVFLSNHYHLILSSEKPQSIPKFMALLNTELAKKVGSRIHRWGHKVFQRRYDASPILDDSALAERLTYIFMHGAKEGLVASPKDWPGLHCVEVLIENKSLAGYWRDESRAHAKRAAHGSKADLSDCDLEFQLRIAQLPLHNPGKVLKECYQVALEKIQEQRKDKRPLGKNKVLKQHAHAKPKKPKEPTCRPWCHALSKKRRDAWRKDYKLFCQAMRQVTLELGTLYRRDFASEKAIGFLPAQI